MMNLLIIFRFFIIPLVILGISPGLGWAAFGPVESAKTWMDDTLATDLFGFMEVRNGWRLQSDDQKDSSIAEARLQADLGRDFGWGLARLKTDLVGDLIEEEARFEIREANFSFTPLDIIDVKAGRQVLTWGTGDLVFINDFFPKDWESFFIGRDSEYLKRPSDAVKTSFYFDFFNLDLVYTPYLNESRYIDGSRLSYWNGVENRIVGREVIFDDQQRSSFWHDAEFSMRLSRNIAGYELAAYGFSGFWKTPEGLDQNSMKLYYPRLRIYGASVRGTILGGIGNVEAGYYDSREDPAGDNPLVRNSEWRLLVGFERELGYELTGSVQGYVELKTDYNAYRRFLRSGSPHDDRDRHLLTVRLTKMLLNQNLRLSVFLYYSPTDQDGYLRPNAQYKLTDNWTIDGGGNIFFGEQDYTFFGQFQNNTNIYLGLRYNY